MTNGKKERMEERKLDQQGYKKDEGRRRERKIIRKKERNGTREKETDRERREEEKTDGQTNK